MKYESVIQARLMREVNFPPASPPAPVAPTTPEAPASPVSTLTIVIKKDDDFRESSSILTLPNCLN